MSKQPWDEQIGQRFAALRDWLATRPFRGPPAESAADYTTGYDRRTADREE